MTIRVRLTIWYGLTLMLLIAVAGIVVWWQVEVGLREALERGLAAWRSGAALDMLAEHLREATAALDGISGRTTPEDLLDRIFSAFCLGK